MYEAVEFSWVFFFKKTHKGVLPPTTYVHTLIHRVTVTLQGVTKRMDTSQTNLLPSRPLSIILGIFIILTVTLYSNFKPNNLLLTHFVKNFKIAFELSYFGQGSILFVTPCKWWMSFQGYRENGCFSKTHKRILIQINVREKNASFFFCLSICFRKYHS